jgi:nucleoside 2-deoxyribosyltransferase
MSLSEHLRVAKKPKLYVGCALTDAPEDFRNDVENLIETLGKDWQVLKFLGLVGGTNADVYTQDIGNVRKCAAFLAIIDYPSTGLGLELGEASKLAKPTLLTQRADKGGSRIVLGAAELVPSFDFETYENMQADLPSIVKEEFAHILTRNRP